MLRIGRGVNEQTFADILNDGGFMGIECTESAQRLTNNYPGEWKLYACDRDGNWSRLELFAKKEARVFKTVSGLCGFMLDKGFAVTAVPLIKGHFIELSKDGNYRHSIE